MDRHVNHRDLAGIRVRAVDADSPQRLVCDDDSGERRGWDHAHQAVELARDLGDCRIGAGSPLLADAHHGHHPPAQHRRDLARHLIRGLAVIAPALRVADLDEPHAEIGQHRR